ncbi:MAG TPA: tRNA epoxyqueuosine(34) reductase QueG [Microthrixaceae bacterium]|nr:tRNA epoxyqueuosine(34) reductase QueG [Microthrixaceae bacterium]
MTDLRTELIDLGLQSGLATVGVCDASPFLEARKALEERRDLGLNGEMQFTYRNPARSTDPAQTVRDARSMVVAAYRYDTDLRSDPSTSGSDPVSASGSGHSFGRVARYATSDHYDRLRVGLKLIAGRLKEHGYRAVVACDDNAMVDRAVAVRAGLGFYGKSANVLLPGQGSWFVLGSVITDAVLEATGSAVADGCGTCTRCIDGCPTSAIIAPGVVDARRCLSWLIQAPGDFPREFREALGNRIYGCDDCQEVCPPSRRADRLEIGLPSKTVQSKSTAPDDPALDPDFGRAIDSGVDSGDGWVDIEWMLVASDDELLDRLGRWYIAKRNPNYLRRNALIVYGNTAARSSSQEVEAVLGPYLDSPDEMLAAHAAWAALKLGHEELLQRSGRNERAAIAAELAHMVDGGENLSE